MIKTIHYIILGPYKRECTYFSMKHGWVTEEKFNLADVYPVDILTLALPQGATGVMAFTVEEEPCGQYDLIGDTHPEGIQNVFQKTY